MIERSRSQSTQWIIKCYIIFVSLPSSNMIEGQRRGRIQYHQQGFNGIESYRFGFSTDDQLNPQSRHEERDDMGNVRGFYSYKDPFDQIQVVHYEANSKHGFRITKTYSFKASIPRKPIRVRKRIKTRKRLKTRVKVNPR